MSGFLERWSARKSESRDPDPAPVSAPPAVIEPVSEAPEGPDGAEIERMIAELPAIEDIDTRTDIRPFLRDFVPAALRNAALRRAWALDPVISTHLDVARDYAWDFNGGANPVGFYSTLDSESVKRGLAALRGDDAAPAGPEMADTPPEADATETTAKPDDLEKIDTEQTDSQTPLLLSRRHGGALPG